MLQIPIQPVPSQLVLCVLGGQNCQIAIYQKGSRVYVDLNSNGSNMCLAALAHNLVPLDACNSYDGFQGNLFFVDTQGLDDPQYTGMGSRWVLVYMTPAELALTEILPVPTPMMSLAAILEVESSAPGNFVVLHGLGTTPFLIEIIPSLGGAIWAQGLQFADSENLYLGASDTGVTATIFVYEMSSFVPLQNVSIQRPAKVIGVTSPSGGNFSVAHGLGAIPSLVDFLLTSNGFFAVQNYDENNIYLLASDEGLTANFNVYAQINVPFNLPFPSVLIEVTSTQTSPFSVSHNLKSVPSKIQILALSTGQMWQQAPADATNIYLQASDGSPISALISIFA